MKMSSDPAADFDAILAARRQGRPIPEDVDPELLELAEFADSLSGALMDVPPPPSGLAPGRQALIEAAERARPPQPKPKRPILGFGPRRVLSWGIAAILILFAITLGSNASASDSLPGDALYPVKRVGERVWLLMSNSPSLQEEIETRREREVLELIRLGRSATVHFNGELVGTGPENWILAGRKTNLTIVLNDDTRVIGQPEIGAQVRVSAEIRNGTVYARLLVVESEQR